MTVTRLQARVDRERVLGFMTDGSDQQLTEREDLNAFAWLQVLLYQIIVFVFSTCRIDAPRRVEIFSDNAQSNGNNHLDWRARNPWRQHHY